MQDYVVAKMFGTGQVTIPKKYRPSGISVNFIVQKKGDDIVFRPLEVVEIFKIEKEEDDGRNWEVLFDANRDGGPMDALKLLKALRKDLSKNKKNNGSDKKISSKIKS